MPLILNAATPVGAVSNTITSSGSKVPDNLSNFNVSEWTNFMTCDFRGGSRGGLLGSDEPPFGSRDSD